MTFEPVNVWNLKPGTAIRVMKTFRAGKEYAEGTILHYEKRDYLPYHSGHTVYFKETTMYLCDNDETSAIVENRGNEFYQIVLE
jgi:Domain of unknown function (DUF3601)